MDRVPYPRGYEGPHSPRSWNSQAVNRGNSGTTADTFNLPSRNSTPGMNGNQSQNPNSSTFEITIPHMYLIHVYGENNSNLNQIQQVCLRLFFRDFLKNNRGNPGTSSIKNNLPSRNSTPGM
ncbi:uncharacterized protein [Cicer arietinum]|uniref:uncharacterized protein n=1 Tax=Cicer arietinum TaxID=3827 RepID=UPI003CC63E43